MSTVSNIYEEQVSWLVDDIEVEATLTRPAGEGPFPAIMMVAGSGPTDRNWNTPLLPGTNGSAAVLAIAETIGKQPMRKRNLIVALGSAEEIGLVGSAAFVNAPPVAVNQLAAYLNFDMVGRMKDNKLAVQATGTSPVWAGVLERANVAAGFDLTLQEDPYQPTDVATFNGASVASRLARARS